MTIPWGTSRHRDFFFLIWELSTLSCSVPSAPLSGKPTPGTSSLLGTSGCGARWHEEPPPPSPEQELPRGETPGSTPVESEATERSEKVTFTKSRQSFPTLSITPHKTAAPREEAAPVTAASSHFGARAMNFRIPSPPTSKQLRLHPSANAGDVPSLRTSRAGGMLCSVHPDPACSHPGAHPAPSARLLPLLRGCATHLN